MLKAYMSGKYKDVSWETIISIVAAIIYFVNPFDLIPDFFPGGFIDDAAVIGYVLHRFKSDIDRFRGWEGGTGATAG